MLMGMRAKVNGQLSQTCYLRALDSCYGRLAAKKTVAQAGAAAAAEKADKGRGGGGGGGGKGRPFVLNDVEHVLCHSPYNKLVQKSFARMAFADARRLREQRKPLGEGQEEALGKWLDVPAEVCLCATYPCADRVFLCLSFLVVYAFQYSSLARLVVVVMDWGLLRGQCPPGRHADKPAFQSAGRPSRKHRDAAAARVRTRVRTRTHTRARASSPLLATRRARSRRQLFSPPEHFRQGPETTFGDILSASPRGETKCLELNVSRHKLSL